MARIRHFVSSSSSQLAPAGAPCAATARTSPPCPPCPPSVASHAPVAGPHTWAVRSTDPLTTRPRHAASASAASGGAALVRDVAAGECDRVLEGHGGDVNALAVSRCGARLATGSDDWTVRVWGLGARAAVRADAGRARGEGSGSVDRTAQVWDPATGACEATLGGHGGLVRAVAAHGCPGWSSAIPESTCNGTRSEGPSDSETTLYVPGRKGLARPSAGRPLSTARSLPSLIQGLLNAVKLSSRCDTQTHLCVGCARSPCKMGNLSRHFSLLHRVGAGLCAVPRARATTRAALHLPPAHKGYHPPSRRWRGCCLRSARHACLGTPPSRVLPDVYRLLHVRSAYAPWPVAEPCFSPAGAVGLLVTGARPASSMGSFQACRRKRLMILEGNSCDENRI
jgi:hypothetical protein